LACAGGAGGEWALTFPARLIIAVRAIWFYLAKLFWPNPLIFIYPRWTIDPSRLLAYMPAVMAVTALVGLWWQRKGVLRPVFFAVAYFVVSLFPVLGFFNVYFFRYSFVGDHFQYLAAIGPLALIGAVVVSASNRFVKKPLLNPALSGVILCLLGALSWRQANLYSKSEILWRDTLRKNPTSWMAQDNVASILLQKGEVAEALELLQRAMESNPNNVVTHNNLGYGLLVAGRLNDSLEHLQRALEIDPNYSGAHANMANTLLQIGRTDEALFHLRKTLELDPGDSEAQKNMAWFLATSPIAHLRDGTNAVKLAESANRLTDGRDAVVVTTLAAAYAEVGRFAEAIQTAERALQLANQFGNTALVEGIRGHIASYCSGQPIRDVR
jgi:protein O-mannosyl-transferase